MFDYNNDWEPYRIGSYNGESYYKRYMFCWVRRPSSPVLKDRLFFAGLSPPVGLVT